MEFGNFEDDTPLFDATLEAPKTAPAFPSVAVPGDDAGPWDRGFNERDPRLGYRAAIKPERLVRGFPLFPNEFDYLGAAKLLLRYYEVWMGGAENGSSWFQTSAAKCS